MHVSLQFAAPSRAGPSISASPLHSTKLCRSSPRRQLQKNLIGNEPVGDGAEPHGPSLQRRMSGLLSGDVLSTGDSCGAEALHSTGWGSHAPPLV